MKSNIKTNLKRASSVDVARAAGVSQATVSYVFNGRKGTSIPAATQERVLNAAKELGYSPNRTAQSLKTGRTHVIAFWTALLDTHVSTQVLHWIRQNVEADGYELIVSGALKPGIVSRWPVDGILAFDSPYEIHALMKSQNMLQVPLVSLGPFHMDEVDYVGVDLYAGVRAAMEHLVQCVSPAGRRIAYLVDKRSNNSGEQRHDAYLTAIQDAGLTPELIILSDKTRAVAREEIKLYIERQGVPNALLCMNDEIAIGAHRGVRDLGLTIPGDVAILGCDGIEETAYHDPPISTIVQPLEEACALGWHFLNNRLKDPGMPLQKETLPSHLVIRASTCPQPIEERPKKEK